MLPQISTMAWALALALAVMTSSASSASVAVPKPTTASEAATAMGTATTPHDKINTLVVQAIVSALMSHTSSNVQVKGMTLAPPLHSSQVLGSLPERIEVELDKIEIGGVALPELLALRANIKSARVNYGNVKIFTKAGGGSAVNWFQEFMHISISFSRTVRMPATMTTQSLAGVAKSEVERCTIDVKVLQSTLAEEVLEINVSQMEFLERA
ncbi:hypothetical protein BGZ81_007127 [Podila clonocystis]|nr:hypothetical protein BGZ81_007127 [Podila clonocystis]